MRKLSILLIACFVACVFVGCVAAQSYNHVIALKPEEYGEAVVNCSQGDLLKISARSVDGDHFYTEIWGPLGLMKTSEWSNETIVNEYKVTVPGLYKIRIVNPSHVSSDVTVEYTISREHKVLFFIHRTKDLQLS